MMNTLANHDILPHDGKRISSDRLLSALQTYLKLSPTASSLLVNTAMKLGTFDEATQTQLLDLSDLAK